jgi:transposase
VEVKLVATPAGEETYVLCRTAARQQKEKAIRSRFSARIEEALGRLAKRVREGRLKDRNKIERQIGKIQARHPQVADLYQMDVEETSQGLRFAWKLVKDCQAWQQLREGAYLLRTNLQAGSAEQLWNQYIQLTEAEAAFRVLKSELLIRPLFHQLERRVKSHVLVAFLGYALWVTLKHLLDRKGSKLSPAKALSLLSSVHSTDIILPTTDGRQIRLRRVTTPNQEQKTLLAHLGLELPERLDFDYECSADSAAG